MNKRLLVMTILMLLAIWITVWAAPGDRLLPLTNRQLMGYSSVKSFNATDRIPIYQNTSARNITGLQLQSVAYQAAWEPNYVKVFQTNSTVSNSPNIGTHITSITRDRRGVVQKIEYESGGQSTGSPILNHRYVYPYDGMTNVSRTTSLVIGTIWPMRGVIATPNISIEGVSGIAIKGLYYGGKNAQGLKQFGYADETGDQSIVDAFFWGTASVGTLAARTTYTIRSAVDVSWGRNGLIMFNAPSAPFGRNPCRAVFAAYSTGTIFGSYSAGAGGATICKSTFKTGS